MLSNAKEHWKDAHRSLARPQSEQATDAVALEHRKPKWLPWTLMPSHVPPDGSDPTSIGTQIERIDWHPEMLRLMVNIVPDVRSTFSTEQMYALAQALRPVVRRHAIEYRVSLPIFGGRFYLAFFAGRERRTLARLEASGQLGLKVRLLAFAIILCVAVGTVTIGILALHAMALAAQFLDTVL